MATEGYVKFEYFTKGIPPYYGNGGFPELLDDQKITIETPNIEMNYHQYVGMFKKFLMAVGFDEKNLIQAGCSLAFNEMNDEKLMREVAEEYELIMSEDLPGIIEDSKKQDDEWIEKHKESWEQRYWALYRKVQQMNSDAYDVAEFEQDMITLNEFLEREDTSNKDMWDQGVMKVTTNDPMKTWNGLIPGSPQAKDQGCICPILDNEEMPDDKKWIDVECPIHGRKK